MEPHPHPEYYTYQDGIILTKMASSRTMVSELSYCVFLVNQWIIWNSNGLNSCSATYVYV